MCDKRTTFLVGAGTPLDLSIPQGVEKVSTKDITNDVLRYKLPELGCPQIIHYISTSLNGIIFINDHIITEDSYSCCIFVNPNASQPLEKEKAYWSGMVRHSNRNTRKYDDFRYDNY